MLILQVTALLCSVGAQSCPQVNVSSNGTSNSTTSSTLAAKMQAAAQAWVYGLPALAIANTRNYYTNLGIPLNYVQPSRLLADAGQRSIVKPNADTLYSIAFFDLSQGPIVLHIPNITTRYFVAALYDAYSNNFANPGTLENSPEGDYLLYGPDDAQCSNMTAAEYNIVSPTNNVAMVARFYVLNATVGSDDYALVNADQDKLYVVPSQETTILSLQPGFSNKTNQTFISYYNLNSAVSDNPIEPEAYNANYSSVGLHSGRSFRPTLSMGNLTTAQAAGNRSIAGAVGQPGFLKTLNNGWILPTSIGTYGTNYAVRSYIANTGLFALTQEQAIYPTYIGAALSTANNTSYRVLFPDGEPPLLGLGFWSLTVYDSDGFFVANAINRYSLGSRDTFMKSGNGSFEIILSVNQPASIQNWLPAPNGVLIPTLRVYQAADATINGNWTYPIITKM